MSISEKFAEAIRFVSEAAMRVFAPNKDKYPETGVQPFDGVPSKDKSGK
ncbi:isochorismate synthase [Oscillatoriales cyanobacterium USR001]|nr:isochorismate synthase [Oscillatoriales cyanobacterium USR001]